MEAVILAVLTSILMVVGGVCLSVAAAPLLALVFWAVSGALLLWILGNRSKWSPKSVAGVALGLLLLLATVLCAILFL